MWETMCEGYWAGLAEIQPNCFRAFGLPSAQPKSGALWLLYQSLVQRAVAKAACLASPDGNSTSHGKLGRKEWVWLIFFKRSVYLHHTPRLSWILTSCPVIYPAEGDLEQGMRCLQNHWKGWRRGSHLAFGLKVIPPQLRCRCLLTCQSAPVVC